MYIIFVAQWQLMTLIKMMIKKVWMTIRMISSGSQEPVTVSWCQDVAGTRRDKVTFVMNIIDQHCIAALAPAAAEFLCSTAAVSHFRSFILMTGSLWRNVPDTCHVITTPCRSSPNFRVQSRYTRGTRVQSAPRRDSWKRILFNFIKIILKVIQQGMFHIG